MGSCKECAYYSKTIDDLNRSFNDVGKESNHYCMMWNDAVPEGAYEGTKECTFYETKQES